MRSQRQTNKAFYCNNTSTRVRFIDQQIHAQQPSQCDLCECGTSLNKYVRRGDVADTAADGGPVFCFFLSQSSQLCVFSQQRPEDGQAAGSPFRDR